DLVQAYPDPLRPGAAQGDDVVAEGAGLAGAAGGERPGIEVQDQPATAVILQPVHASVLVLQGEARGGCTGLRPAGGGGHAGQRHQRQQAGAGPAAAGAPVHCAPPASATSWIRISSSSPILGSCCTRPNSLRRMRVLAATPSAGVFFAGWLAARVTTASSSTGLVTPRRVRSPATRRRSPSTRTERLVKRASGKRPASK